MKQPPCWHSAAGRRICLTEETSYHRTDSLVVAAGYDEIIETSCCEAWQGAPREASIGRPLDVSGRPPSRERIRKDCLGREIKEELPKLKLGHVSLWKEVTAKNKRSGRKMSDAIFVAKNARGKLVIGDPKEIDRAVWRKPSGIRLMTATSRYIRDKLFPK